MYRMVFRGACLSLLLLLVWSLSLALYTGTCDLAAASSLALGRKGRDTEISLFESGLLL